MSDSHVTQCPQCRTSFRVSQAQLAAARGMVRCGACLHVFNAAQQILAHTAATNPTPSPAAVKPAPSTPSNKQSHKAMSHPQETLWIHDDLDLDSLDLDGELERLLEHEQRQLQPSPSHEPTPQAEPKSIWTLVDDPEPISISGLSAEREPLPLADEQPPSEAELPPPKRRDKGEAKRAHEPELSALASEPNDLSDDLETELRSEPNLGREPLFELDDEPLELNWQAKPRPQWGRILTWSLLNVLAAAALAAQYISYNFAELSRQDALRPWFEQLCPHIGCTLPAKVDISQIRSSNLVVRSHSQFNSALVVDAILYNRAPFAQPFPLLEMRFADLNGQLIASRRFKPSEYLAGELAGQSQMPPQTPIHISLDILDPGPRAVNYSLNFHSPQ